MSDEALIIVDLQNDYFPGGSWELDGIDEAAANAARVLAAFRRRGLPVIHIRHESPAADAPFFVPGSYGAATSDTVAPRDGETVVVKHHPNAFRDTPLRSILEAGGIGRLTILGAMSHICIDATARAAADLGYDVTLVHDAVATRDLAFGGTEIPSAQVHASFMAALAFAYARVIPTEEQLS